MAWTEYRTRSWPELQGQFSGASELDHAFRRTYLYRGQADASLSLKPSLIRDFKSTVELSTVLELETRLGQEFEARAHLHLTPHLAQSLKGIGERMALMQHFGAPTRLLDWTTSPYVAAYFACASNPRMDAVIWATQIEALNSPIKAAGTNLFAGGGELGPMFFERSTPEYVCALQHSIRSDRMIAQQGIFTVCTNPLADHSVAIDAQIDPSLTPPRHFKIFIEGRMKLEIIKQLRAMNITAASLYPGLEGLGKSLQETTRLASEFGI